MITVVRFINMVISVFVVFVIFSVFIPPEAVALGVSGVRWYRIADDCFVVWYDLDSPVPVNTAVELTPKGGSPFRPRAVEGDIGPHVEPGHGKRVVCRIAPGDPDISAGFTVAVITGEGAVPAPSRMPLIANAAHLQEVPGGTGISNGAINVYLDFERRYRDYEDYIKTEIPVVNYVRDRKQADVHILMTTQETGSRGHEYTIALIGQQMYADINDTLRYISKQMDAEEKTRSGVTQKIKIGLLPYISRSTQAEKIRISFTPSATGKSGMQEVNDKWDYWVFNINTNNRLSGEEARKTLFVRGSVSADRITPDWKLSFRVDGDYNERTYETDDGTINSITRSQRFRSLIVKSRGDHWSTGFFGSAESSIYNNLKLSYDIAPAIEYDVFPYSESTRREFRILYRGRVY